ncbi:MAG: cysteine--tRNA ligase [Gammaproteobacteria bacterium]|nr:cysteine--tRNA ligase [Gammaproteobacteria bacterium]
MLKIYNTLTSGKEVFEPIEAGKIRIYVCGITVYDYCHLGHARMMVVFDMVTRYLRSRAYEVTYVRNITDIDDKIINRANENGETIQMLTERFISAMNDDMDALGVLRPDQEPRATTHIEQITAMISRLIDNKYAYIADNGDVYYDVSAFPEYGKLSGKKTDELRAGARVEVQEAKDDPLDFVLWKAAKPDEPSWQSPWGAGRPGWHIECSAMATHCLGDHFDIHGGGQDLQFPHHENEIAQSCSATGKAFVNTWMHNGFVRVDEEKMSKSLGNFFTVREVLEKYHPEVVRFFILSSHYRSPLNYSDSHLDEARATLDGLYLALREVTNSDDSEIDNSFLEKFNEAMDDDFNTPKAVAVLHEIAHAINRETDKDARSARTLGTTLKQLGATMGLLQAHADAYLKSAAVTESDGLTADEINTYIEQRKQARINKDFAESDRIRNLLTEQGITLEDSPTGTSWRRL